MIKVQVRQEDVQAAKRYFSKQPRALLELHDPLAQAIKRICAKDPRWCRPRIDVDSVNFIPRSKYPNLRPFSIDLPKKAQKYCKNFDNWFANGFNGKDPGTIDFVLKNISLVDGRIRTSVK